MASRCEKISGLDAVNAEVDISIWCTGRGRSAQA